MTAAAEGLLLEWTKEAGDLEAPLGGTPDFSLFADGRVRLGPRLGGGEVSWHRLSPSQLEELRRFVFDEQALLDIDREALAAAVRAAAAQQQEAVDSSVAILVTAPQCGADTTVIRAAGPGGLHELRYFGLFGDAQRYPEVEALQRLRRIELRLLGVYEELTAKPSRGSA